MAILGTLTVMAAAMIAQAASGTATTEAIAALRLQDGRGAWHALDDVRDSKLVVLAFVGTECPLADLYMPKLAELARQHTAKGVAFFGIDSNAQDAPSALVLFAKKHDLPYPLLKDVGNELADRLGVKRTPEVVVLDAERKVRYQGRVDDQYGFGVHRLAATKRELAQAIDDLLAGREVTTPRTEAAGCLIGRVQQTKTKGPVTYANEIARILRDRCIACHRAGEIGPFSLTSYKKAAGWSEMIAEVVRDGRMPPWHASPEFGKFTNDGRLTDAEKKAIDDWLAAGAPEGDPRDLPPPAEYPDGWRISKPDLILSMPDTVDIPADGTLPYQNFLIDPKLDHDVWVRASQVRPGNPSVVHHLVVYILPPGSDRAEGMDFLAAYAPGMPPRVLPEGLGKLVPAGSKLLFQLHYTPRGVPQKDRSEIGLVFAETKSIRKRMTSFGVINTNLKIPAGAADHAARAEHRFGQNMILYAMMPHMHMRGKSFRFEATYPDGHTDVLLDVPRYQFDWQNMYVLAEPLRMPEGTILRCLARYDNSADNPSNPDPNKTVRWGEQTWEEMLVGYVDAALADQDIALGGPTSRKLDDGRYEVTFQYTPKDPAKEVYLAGTFNDWKPTGLKMDGPDPNGRYTAKLELKPGTYEYKFVLDGTRWHQDPGNDRQVGFYNNSVVDVGK